MKTIDVLYSDNHLFAVNKPSGVIIQKDETGDLSLLEIAKEFIREKFKKQGNVYLGLIHRLDRPVSGAVLFARTSKAAGRLSLMFRNKTITKKYWALVEGKVQETEILKNYIHRENVTSFIVSEGKGLYAELSYKRLEYKKNISFVEITLKTGRHHQIRVQFAHSGHPVIGDLRYGSKIHYSKNAIALHAHELSFFHPVTKEKITIIAEPPEIFLSKQK